MIAGFGGETIDLGQGWKARIDNTPAGKHVHVYNDKVGKWSQNSDGSPHDEGSNRPGGPPKWVKEKLKEKKNWDWDKKTKQYKDKKAKEEKAKNAAKVVATGVAFTGGHI